MDEQQTTIHQLASLAKEGTITDPIDWAQLTVEEDQAFLMMASQVFEQMEGCPEDQRAVVAMATMTKLLVENFVLNLRLQGQAKNDK